MLDLIYCAGGNKRFAQIAIDAGFRYGSRLPDTVYHALYFADQDWRNPNRALYMNHLKRHTPHMATVLDWEREEQLPEVLSWAEEISEIVSVIVIVPKVFSGITHIPEIINGKEVRLGYSVPTSFGGTQVPIWEFTRRSVHLLGGSPQRQMEISRYLHVVSADGNMAQKLAVRQCQFWVPGNARYAKNRYWPMLVEASRGRVLQKDAPYVAFELSCRNIMAAWKEMLEEL